MTAEPSSSELVDRLRQKYALTQDEIYKHTQTFKLYDKNNNGLVSLDELAKEVDKQAQFFKDKSRGEGLRRIFIGRLKRFSKRDDGHLTYSEFITCKYYGKIADGFRSVQYKGDYRGYVEPQDLKVYLMAKCKSELNEELIDHVLNSMAKDKGGRLTFHEFMEAFFLFVLSSDNDHKPPPDQLLNSPNRAHLHDEVMLKRLKQMFRLEENQENDAINHFKASDSRNVATITFEQFLDLDAADGESDQNRDRRQERIRQIVQLSPQKTDSDKFTVDDYLTLMKANKVYAYMMEDEESDSDYQMEKEKLRKYLHKKIWLRGVSGRFMDELLDSMELENEEEISMDSFAIALSAVIFPLGK